jgi:hypothetical protein
MPTTTLQSLITAFGAGSGDLSPLAANTTFERAVNAELSARAAVVVAAENLAATTDDLTSGVAVFSGAMRAIRLVAKRFPETAKFADEAAKQVQLAMGVVAYNPQPVGVVNPTAVPAPAAPEPLWRRKWTPPPAAPAAASTK